jgi:hypothetical protein
MATCKVCGEDKRLVQVGATLQTAVLSEALKVEGQVCIGCTARVLERFDKMLAPIQRKAKQDKGGA